MEKFGVDTSSEDGQKNAADVTKCPTCGRVVQRDGQVMRCSVCGSKPFETEAVHGPR